VASLSTPETETEPFGDSAQPLKADVPKVLLQFFQQRFSILDGIARLLSVFY